MRYFVLSDIHSNIEALEACARKAKQVGYDAVLCCGDIVGYGPNPMEVMDFLKELATLSIRGNHDRVASGLDDPTHFNVAARQAIEWTREHLSEPHRQQLRELPVGPVRVTDETQLVHGSIRDEDEYLVTSGDAVQNLALTKIDFTFFGHTHEPVIFTKDGYWRPTYAADGTAIVKLPADRVMVNPGSVGQPRDGDPRASFVIWDEPEHTLEFCRAEYPVETTQQSMRAAGLPEFLVTRLALGR